MNRRVYLPLCYVLNALVDCQVDVLSRKRVLVLNTFRKDQTSRSIAKPTNLFDVSAKLVIKQKLEPVLAFPIWGNEAKKRACQFAIREVSTSLPFDL